MGEDAVPRTPAAPEAVFEALSALAAALVSAPVMIAAARAARLAARPASARCFTTLSVEYEAQCAASQTARTITPPRPRQLPDVLPEWVVTELRTSHAGEAGATWIYKGAGVAARLRGHSDEFHAFVSEHHDNEASHFEQFDELLEPGQCSSLLPLWRGAGFVVGFGSTMISERQM